MLISKEAYDKAQQDIGVLKQDCREIMDEFHSLKAEFNKQLAELASERLAASTQMQLAQQRKEAMNHMRDGLADQSVKINKLTDDVTAADKLLDEHKAELKFHRSTSILFDANLEALTDLIVDCYLRHNTAAYRALRTMIGNVTLKDARDIVNNIQGKMKAKRKDGK